MRFRIWFHVNRLQTRIAKANHEGKWNLIKRLQYLLTNSHIAKLLAVRIVTQNRGSRNSKIDGVR
ncbi:MAG: reverse transcriptase N-terminal domain-containing protein [Methanosarcinales archaeon]|nr:reverse transcriptase N-terminal domain-containing protein [Methanosarcinales archaeon]